MSLSEHERKLLAEMEEALSADDPRLVSTLTGNRLYPGRNRALLGVGLLALGIATIFVGLIGKITLVGVLGFLIALTGVTLVISGLSGVSNMLSNPSNNKNKKRNKGKLNNRLEDRWEKRNFDQ
jgi:predicted phage tail protein